MVTLMVVDFKEVWENGLFSAGEFIGSATFSALVELLLEVLHR
jgi:hypothetical protein